MDSPRVKAAYKNAAAPADKLLYAKVVADAKGKFDVWPSVYASSWVVKEYKRRGGRYINPLEGLGKWYAETWVDLGRSIDSKGYVKSWVQCGRPSADQGPYPKCVPLAKAKTMTPAQRLSAVRRKRLAERGSTKRKGRPPINVRTGDPGPKGFNGGEKTMKKNKANRKQDGIERTAAQTAAENKAIAKYIKYLKSDRRTTWEIVTDDPDYVLILRAPLYSDLSGYEEYGWSGPFKYLEEAYAESGPFSFRSGVDEIPYMEYGLVRSKVLSDKELKDLHRKSTETDSVKRWPLQSSEEDRKKSGQEKISDMKNEGKSKKKSNLKKKARKAGREIKKVAKSDVGRAGLGGGIGALALGPVGAIAGAGIAMATKKEKGAKKNPSLAKSIKQKRARSGAVKSARASSVGSEVSKKSLRARLAQINPVTSGPMDKTLDQYAKSYIKKRAVYLSAAMATDSSPGDIARAKKKFDDAAQKLTLYAEIRNMDPVDLQRFMEHAAKKQEDALRKKNPNRGNPLKRIPKGASQDRARDIISQNIATEMDSGRPQDQAVAIALNSARKDAPDLMDVMYPIRNPYHGDAVELAKMKKKGRGKRGPPPAPQPPSPRSGGSKKSLAANTRSQNPAKDHLQGDSVTIELPFKADDPRMDEFWSALGHAWGKGSRKYSKKSEADPVDRCRKLWDQYCDKPTKSNLRKVLDHLDSMKSSKSEKVKKERARCLRAANKEAKRLKLK